MNRYAAWLFVLLAACGSSNQGGVLVVEVFAEGFTPGADFDEVFLSVQSTKSGRVLLQAPHAMGEGAGQFKLPLRVALSPSNPFAEPVEVRASARLDGLDLVSQTAIVSVPPDGALTLKLVLSVSCRAVTCSDADDTCYRGACAPKRSFRLTEFQPTLDPMLPDAGGEDADPGAPDAPIAGPPDGAQPDAPMPDAFLADAASPDAASPDAMPKPDVGPEVMPPPCGRKGEPCCGGMCGAPQTVCKAATCVDCGVNAGPCCAGNVCNAGLSCGGGLCAPCGGANQPCCAGNACGANLACNAGTCTPCGALNQSCCAGAMCGANLTCGGSTCVACGALNQPCCGTSCGTGLACASGTCKCPSGVLQCGSTCRPGLACCPGQTGGSCGQCGTDTCTSSGQWECQGQHGNCNSPGSVLCIGGQTGCPCPAGTRRECDSGCNISGCF
jgi:hypothetical protein